MTTEQRKYIRFLTRQKTFAALRSGFDKAGRVLDISINGLAFSYILEETISAEQFQVDIFQSETGFYISNIPCRIVYDTPIAISRYEPTIQPRRCGLCFGRLSDVQQDNLTNLLRKSIKATVAEAGFGNIAENFGVS